MALITTGNGFIRSLEKFGALGVYVPLEGAMKVGISADYGLLAMLASILLLGVWVMWLRI